MHKNKIHYWYIVCTISFFQQVAQSKHLVFLVSPSNMEEYNLRVFIMVTHSGCGALPLGIIVTSNEKKPTLVDALELYQSATSDFGFHGATASGPRVFMSSYMHQGCYLFSTHIALHKDRIVCPSARYFARLPLFCCSRGQVYVRGQVYTLKAYCLDRSVEGQFRLI